VARVRWTDRGDGDQRHPPVGPSPHRPGALPWSWLRQVHGARVWTVSEPGGVQGAEGDALVTARAGVPLVVFTADCAPVALASPEGVVGVAHAGWRGLAAGVLGAAVAAMRQLGATEVVAALGPCIHVECYEFGTADLDGIAARLGPAVRGTTASGRPALDLPAAVRAALGAADAVVTVDADCCTACSPAQFSHRARGDTGRQATIVVGTAPEGAT